MDVFKNLSFSYSCYCANECKKGAPTMKKSQVNFTLVVLTDIESSIISDSVSNVERTVGEQS